MKTALLVVAAVALSIGILGAYLADLDRGEKIDRLESELKHLNQPKNILGELGITLDGGGSPIANGVYNCDDRASVVVFSKALLTRMTIISDRPDYAQVQLVSLGSSSRLPFANVSLLGNTTESREQYVHMKVGDRFCYLVSDAEKATRLTIKLELSEDPR